MLATLAQHEETDCQSLFTGDETWILCKNHQDTVWLAPWEEPEEFQKPTHHQEKSMVTIFFTGAGQFYVSVLPQEQRMNSAYFTERVLTDVAEVCAREQTVPKENLTVHFDSAPIPDTQMVREMLMQWNIARIGQPPYIPDLAPCDFFLFGPLKQFVPDVQFSTEQELINVIIGFLEVIPPQLWSDVFENRKGRLQTCLDAGGTHFE
jgi:hypothetical protein